MKKKFKKTLRSTTHPIKPKVVIKSKKDKLKTRRAGKIDMRQMIDKLGDLK
jgi:hypothetical protein